MNRRILMFALPILAMLAVLLAWLFMRPSTLSSMEGPNVSSDPAPIGAGPGAAQTPAQNPAPPKALPKRVTLPESDKDSVVEALELLPGQATVSCEIGRPLVTPRAVQSRGGPPPILAPTGNVLWLRVDRDRGAFELLDYLEPIGDIRWTGADGPTPQCEFIEVKRRSVPGTLLDASGDPLADQSVKGCFTNEWAVTDAQGRFTVEPAVGRPCTVAAFSDANPGTLQMAKASVAANSNGPIALQFGEMDFDPKRQDMLAAQLATMLERGLEREADRMQSAFDTAISKATAADQRAYLIGLRDQWANVQAERQAQLDLLSGGGPEARQALKDSLANGQ